MATQKYDRDGAVNYAARWWNGHNPQFPDYDNDGNSNTSDCANFVSQCLREGGKMPQKFTADTNAGYDTWYFRSVNDRTSSWTGAQSLRLFIKSNTVGYPRIGFSFLSNSQVGQLEKGDLVFALENKNASKPQRKATHVALVNYVSNGKIYVYAHSSPKNGSQAWGAALDDTILCKLADNIQLSHTDVPPEEGWLFRYGEGLLKQGMPYSEYVKNFQEDLNHWCDQVNRERFFTPNLVDGKFGAGTKEAVKVFQGANGLTADGVVGNKTKDMMYNLLYY